MGKIIEVNVDGEKVYLKKGKHTNYRVIYPIKKELDKPFSKENFNWKNFIYGGLENTLVLLFILFLTLTFFYIYNHDTKEMQKVVENPCEYCLTNDMKLTLGERLQARDEINKLRNKSIDLNYSFYNG